MSKADPRLSWVVHNRAVYGLSRRPRARPWGALLLTGVWVVLLGGIVWVLLRS